MIAGAAKVAIKAGGGTRGHDAAIRRLAEAAGAAVILSPGSTGVLPDAHAQNMHVGGSKGSISGNYAMAEAELLIIIGSRAVCQADCSGDRLQARAGSDQYQWRSGRRTALQQDARVDRRYFGCGRSPCSEAGGTACQCRQEGVAEVLRRRKKRNGPVSSTSVLNAHRCATRFGRNRC